MSAWSWDEGAAAFKPQFAAYDAANLGLIHLQAARPIQTEVQRASRQTSTWRRTLPANAAAAEPLEAASISLDVVPNA
jgi:hypothetical protein